MPAVGLQPHALLGAIQTVREDRDLLGDPFLRELAVLEKDPHPLAQPVPHRRQPVGGAFADLRHPLPDRFHPGLQITPERLALHLLHSYHVFGSLPDHLAEQRCVVVGIRRRLLPDEDVRERGEGPEVDVTGQAVLLFQLPQERHVPVGRVLVEAERGGRLRLALSLPAPGHRERDLASREPLGQELPRLRFQGRKGPGKTDRKLAESMIYGSDLGRQAEAVHQRLAPTVTRHASNHCRDWITPRGRGGLYRGGCPGVNERSPEGRK